MVSRFEGLTVFQPVINGVGGNLVAVQASRISTALHKQAELGTLLIPPGHTHPVIFITPIASFFGKGKFFFFFFIAIIVIIIVSVTDEAQSLAKRSTRLPILPLMRDPMSKLANSMINLIPSADRDTGGRLSALSDTVNLVLLYFTICHVFTTFLRFFFQYYAFSL